MMPGHYGATRSSARLTITEFNALKQKICSDIALIKNQWKKLEKAINCQKIDKDWDKIHKQQSPTNGKILATSQDLKKLFTLLKPEDKREKLIISRVANEFKYLVEKYQECQKKLTIKQNKSLKVKAIQYQDIENDIPDGPCTSQESDYQLKVYGRSEEMKMQILEDRAEMVYKIETDLEDLFSMMNQLNTEVSKQGDDVDNIEAAVEGAVDNIEIGASDLAKAAKYQQKFRKKSLICFSIAIVFFTILIICLILKF